MEVPGAFSDISGSPCGGLSHRSPASFRAAGAGVTVLLGPGTEAALSSCVLTVCCPSCMELPARSNRAQGTARPAPPAGEGAGSHLLGTLHAAPHTPWGSWRPC